jgi:hypothetical protein
MGISSSGYGESLAKLAKQLSLDDRVTFEGYRDRSEIHRVLDSKRHIAVSSSLHSDENFGMAQFRSIVSGNLAVLTRWGGYADFGKNFPKQVRMAPVLETPRGPWVDPVGFSKLLEAAAKTYRSESPKVAATPSCYLEKRITEHLRKLATDSWKSGARLEMTPLAKRILKKRSLFEKKDPNRIFESYADPDTKTPVRGYLMSSAKDRALRVGALRCSPWVSIGTRAIQVRDPHRGDLDFKIVPRGPVSVTDWAGKSARVDRSTAKRLLSLGYTETSS